MREGVGSGNSGLSGLSAIAKESVSPAKLDVIEVNFHGGWLESHWSYDGPDGGSNLDEIRFFDC